MVGIDLVKDPVSREPDSEGAAWLMKAALRRGWLLLGSGPSGNVISLSPPLNISRPLLDRSVDLLDELLTGLAD
jgi:4-aminobutyrate aminotransferase/(S)-3-amino-2-methylpropionate transaminase